MRRDPNIPDVHEDIPLFHIGLRQSAEVSEACQLLPTTAKPGWWTYARGRKGSVEL